MTIGLLWASAGWKLSRIKTSTVFYARQVTEDPIACWFNRHFVAISLGVLLLPGVAGWLVGERELALKWFCYFGAFRVFIGYFFAEFVVNGLCHTLGSRKFHAKGKSTNLVFIAPITLGATLHHNHHAFPGALSPAIDGEIDTMQVFYWIFKKLNWIQIKPSPSNIKVAEKKIRKF